MVGLGYQIQFLGSWGKFEQGFDIILGGEEKIAREKSNIAGNKEKNEGKYKRELIGNTIMVA